MLHEAGTEAELPVVGDWVALAPRPDEGAGTIHAVLPRRTRISRKTPWLATKEQVLAANVDSVLLATSLNEDLNLRRLERYLTTAWDSGAEPVLVLTKADLHPDPEAARAEVESIAYGVPVIPLWMDSFGQSGTVSDLYAYAGIDAEHIIEAALLASEIATQQ